MKSPVAGIVTLILLFLVVIVGYSSIFTVSQTEQALVVRLGRPVDVVSEPGLNFKAPFIDTVISIDKRILDLENPSQEVIASDQKRLVVDAFARYRIKNPLRFYQSIGSIQAANIQLTTLLNAALRRVLGEVSFINVVRDEREGLMTRIRDQLDREADQYGIQVVDVRIRRADLPEQNSQAVYKRMQTEREREAQEFRAQGGQKAQEIRSKADREATVIVADANSTAEQTRGVGDAERNRLFAEAYGRDPEFFAFYRSMSAYETGLRSNDTRFLLRPDSEFFRFFANPSGHPPAARGAEAIDVRPEYTRYGEADPLRRHKSKRRLNSGGLVSDEVHSVHRLPRRCGHPLCARRPDVRRQPSLDAPGDEERAGNAGQYPADRRHRLGGRGSGPDLVRAAVGIHRHSGMVRRTRPQVCKLRTGELISMCNCTWVRFAPRNDGNKAARK